MDPNFGVWLNTRHTEPFRDELERELVTYRTAADRPSHRLIVASRHHLAKLFLAIGERLEETGRAKDATAATKRTLT